MRLIYKRESSSILDNYSSAHQKMADSNNLMGDMLHLYNRDRTDFSVTETEVTESSLLPVTDSTLPDGVNAGGNDFYSNLKY